MYQGRAWSIQGTKAQRKAFFVWTMVRPNFLNRNHVLTLLLLSRFSVLPALSLQDGIIYCDIIEGSFCTETFYSFIASLLNNMQPYPVPNSVIVMDNCQIHKHPDIIDLIHS